MLVATAALFYVSYWLLSKMEVAKWNRFVKGKVQDALVSGSAFALPSVAFLAVYREGVETVLFYKALLVAGPASGAVMPVLLGIAAASVVLGVVYVLINRFGVRLPLKPFFGVTSAFLYYMAFVFMGKGIAELQGGGVVPITVVSWAPQIERLGIYRTVESLAAQGILLVLLLGALVWTFYLEPRRLRVTQELVPDPVAPVPGRSRGRARGRECVRHSLRGGSAPLPGADGRRPGRAPRRGRTAQGAIARAPIIRLLRRPLRGLLAMTEVGVKCKRPADIGGPLA